MLQDLCPVGLVGANANACIHILEHEYAVYSFAADKSSSIAKNFDIYVHINLRKTTVYIHLNGNV